MTKDEMEPVVEAAVQNTLTKLGFDTDNIHAAQADMLFLRRQRQGSEMLAVQLKRVLLLTFLSGAFTAIWLGFKQMLGK